MKSALVIGLGRFGRSTALKLMNLGIEVMAVDENEEDVQAIVDDVTSAVAGDCTDEEFLRSLGIPDFDICFVTISENFLASLEATFYLKELGAKKIISRASRDTQEKFLERNGADAVIYPERHMGEWAAVRYSSDRIIDHISLASGLMMFEVMVPMRWIGKTLVQLDIRRKLNLNVIAIIHGEDSDPTPNPDYVFEDGDKILVLGHEKQLRAAFNDDL